MGVVLRILILLVLSSPFSVLAKYTTQEDIAYEMAAIQVATDCKSQGKTDVSVSPQSAITSGMNQTGLSRQQVLHIIQKPSTQAIAKQYVMNMNDSIHRGRLSCTDVVMFAIGGLMTD